MNLRIIQWKNSFHFREGTTKGYDKYIILLQLYDTQIHQLKQLLNDIMSNLSLVKKLIMQLS